MTTTIEQQDAHGRRHFLRRCACLGSGLIYLSLAACSQENQAKVAADPQNIPANATCELDGMLLKDYPGPKGQIHYADGKVHYFCDTVELIALMKSPESVRTVVGSYVQDMGQADWQQPAGHWIDAEKALYVIGSKKLGSMGPTFATFAEATAADTFVKAFGGKVVRFEAIDASMARLDGGVLNDTGM